MSIEKCSVRMPAIGTKAYQMVDGKVCAIKLLSWRVKCMGRDKPYNGPKPFYWEEYVKYWVTSVWQVAGREEPLEIKEEVFGSNIYMLNKPVYSSPDAFTSAKAKRDLYLRCDTIDLMDMIIEQCPQVNNEFTIHKCYVGCHYRDGYAFRRWYWDGGMAQPTEMTFDTILCDCNGLHLIGMQFCGKDKGLRDWCDTYATKELCEAQNTMQVVEFDDDEHDEDDFAEQKREEFRDYVAHHCPGFEDRIYWEYFMNLKSMPENLAMQVENWTRA